MMNVMVGNIIRVADYGLFKVVSVDHEKNFLYVKMKFEDGAVSKDTMMVDPKDFFGQIEIVY